MWLVIEIDKSRKGFQKIMVEPFLSIASSIELVKLLYALTFLLFLTYLSGATFDLLIFCYERSYSSPCLGTHHFGYEYYIVMLLSRQRVKIFVVPQILFVYMKSLIILNWCFTYDFRHWYMMDKNMLFVKLEEIIMYLRTHCILGSQHRVSSSSKLQCIM